MNGLSLRKIDVANKVKLIECEMEENRFKNENRQISDLYIYIPYRSYFRFPVFVTKPSIKDLFVPRYIIINIFNFFLVL